MTLHKDAVTKIKVILSGIAALILSVGVARFAYTPMLPIMQLQTQLDDVSGGWLAAVNYAGYIAGALLASSLRSLQHKFVIYRIGLLLALITTPAMALTNNVVLWCVLRFFSGVSSTAGLLLASGLVLNWLLRHNHKPLLGVHFSGMGLGIIVGGLGVGITANIVNWDSQWLILGVIGIVFFIPAWYWMPAPSSDTRVAPAIQTPLTRHQLVLLILSYFCAGFGYVISATYIVAILVKLQSLALWGGYIWVLVGIAALPSSFLWDVIAQRIGPVSALMLAYGIQALSFLLPVFSDNVAMNLLSAVLFGATFVGIVSLMLTLIGRYYPANPAKAMSRLTLSYGVAQIVAPLLTGYLVMYSGSYQSPLIMASVILTLGLLLLYPLRNEKGAT